MKSWKPLTIISIRSLHTAILLWGNHILKNLKKINGLKGSFWKNSSKEKGNKFLVPQRKRRFAKNAMYWYCYYVFMSITRCAIDFIHRLLCVSLLTLFPKNVTKNTKWALRTQSPHHVQVKSIFVSHFDVDFFL